MTWDDLQPYVLPYVPGCPDPVLEHHARLTAIDFCRRTNCIKKALDPEPADGITLDVEPLPDTGLQIIKVLSVGVDGRPFTLVSTMDGVDLVSYDDTNEFAFMRDSKTVAVNPLQAAGAQVEVYAVLAPSNTASSLPDELAQYAQDIAMGVIASIQMVPGQSFTNVESAALQKVQYDRRVGIIATTISRGNSRVKMRSRATYL